MAMPNAVRSSGASRWMPRVNPVPMCGKLVEFSKRFKVEEVWPEELIAKKPEYRGKTLYDVLYANGQVDKFPLQDITDERGNVYNNQESKDFGFYLQKGLYEEYRIFGLEGPKKGHELGEFDAYHKIPRHALAGDRTARKPCGVTAQATIRW